MSEAYRTKDMAPAQILLVLLGQGRGAHGHARQVDALVGGHGAGHDDLGVHVVAFDLGDLKADLAVVDEDRITGMAVARKTLEGGGDLVLIANDLVGGDDELLAFLQEHLVGAVHAVHFLHPAGADLRTLDVNEDGNVLAEVLGGLADVLVYRLMLFECTVGTVDTGNVHTRFDELGDLLQRIARGTEGIYNLGFAHSCLPISC